MENNERALRDRRIAELYPSLTMQQIADVEGVSRPTVSRILKEAGLSPRDREWRERNRLAVKARHERVREGNSERDRAIASHHPEKSVRLIAREFGLSKSRVGVIVDSHAKSQSKRG